MKLKLKSWLKSFKDWANNHLFTIIAFIFGLPVTAIIIAAIISFLSGVNFF